MEGEGERPPRVRAPASCGASVGPAGVLCASPAHSTQRCPSSPWPLSPLTTDKTQLGPALAVQGHCFLMDPWMTAAPIAGTTIDTAHHSCPDPSLRAGRVQEGLGLLPSPEAGRGCAGRAGDARACCGSPRGWVPWQGRPTHCTLGLPRVGVFHMWAQRGCWAA